jgi:hypothetical protein
MQSFPSFTPGWIIRQPALLSRWLAWAERLRRVGWRRVGVIAAAVGSITALVVVAADRFSPDTWIPALREHWPLVLAVAGIHSTMTVARRHRRAMAGWSESWLATAPVTSTSVRLTHAIDSFAALFFQYLMACGVLLIVAVVDRHLSASMRPLAAVTAGVIVGSAISWWLPAGKHRELREASRYAPSVVAGTAAPLRPSNDGLSHWPIARAVSTGRPENARELFVAVAMFAVQSGASAVQGLVIMLSWTIAGYLVSLLSAGVSVANEAGRWLLPTPMSFVGFAWPLARRALLHQLAGTAVVAAIVMASGSSAAVVWKMGLLWTALVVVSYATALWMSYRA